MKSSEPSRANAATDSPAADRVIRRGFARPAVSTCQSAVFIFLPSTSGRLTATTRRLPSGESFRADRRGIAMNRSKVNGSLTWHSSLKAAPKTEMRGVPR